MRAVVYREYGPPEIVLHCEDVDQPTPGDDEVLIKVRAAAVNPLDAHLMKGKPHTMRLFFGLTKPRTTRPGRDVAGQVTAIGKSVTQFAPGDEVFGVCLGAFAEYACASETRVVKKPRERLIRAGGVLACRRADRTPGPARPRTPRVRSARPDQRRVGRRRDVRGPDREVDGRGSDRRLQHQKRRDGEVAWGGSRHRLHEGELHHGSPIDTI